MVFCRIMIPRFDITKVIAKEVVRNKARLIFTFAGALFKNVRKFLLKSLINSKRYIRFSIETTIPNRGKNYC